MGMTISGHFHKYSVQPWRYVLCGVGQTRSKSPLMICMYICIQQTLAHLSGNFVDAPFQSFVLNLLTIYLFIYLEKLPLDIWGTYMRGYLQCVDI